MRTSPRPHAALAATLETAARGVIYEQHARRRIAAGASAASFRRTFDETAQQGGSRTSRTRRGQGASRGRGGGGRDGACVGDARRDSLALVSDGCSGRGAGADRQALARTNRRSCPSRQRARAPACGLRLMRPPVILRCLPGRPIASPWKESGIMAKRCEICGQEPGRRAARSATRTTSGPRRFEPNLQTVRAIVNGGVRRTARVHPLPAVGQGRQGRLKPAPMRDHCHRRRPEGRSGRTRQASRRPVAVPVRPDPARSRDRQARRRATSRPRRVRCFENLGAVLEAGGLVFDARRPDHGVSRRHERLRGDERGLRDVLHRAGTRRARPSRPPGCRATRASKSTSSRSTTV